MTYFRFTESEYKLTNSFTKHPLCARPRLGTGPIKMIMIHSLLSGSSEFRSVSLNSLYIRTALDVKM